MKLLSLVFFLAAIVFVILNATHVCAVLWPAVACICAWICVTYDWNWPPARPR